MGGKKASGGWDAEEGQSGEPGHQAGGQPGVGRGNPEGKTDGKTDGQISGQHGETNPGSGTTTNILEKNEKVTLLSSHWIGKWKKTLFSEQINRSDPESPTELPPETVRQRPSLTSRARACVCGVHFL